MGGRIGSEQVADFRRNGWPDCVGISGRLGSDYAIREHASRFTPADAKTLETIMDVDQRNVDDELKTRLVGTYQAVISYCQQNFYSGMRVELRWLSQTR